MATAKKSQAATKKTTKRAPAEKTETKSSTKSTKVDYYPNRVPFYVAISAVMILFLLAMITAL